jgi:hypothetical protein
LPEVHDVPWAAIASLPFPAAPPSRATWTKAQLAQIQPFEGVALRTTGFLSHPTNVESSGKGESTNCHFHQPEDVDWHIYLVEHDGDGIDKSVIVETTPRVRRRFHPKWDAAVLDRWVGSGKPIRISGFLMLDPEHRNQVGKFRVTVWELHPIMNIEVCDASSCGEGDWKPLDQVQ